MAQQYLQIGGIAASLISCLFWLMGAATGLRPTSLLRFSGPDSIPSSIRRQAVFNGLAALFAALAAACQATALYLHSN